MAEVSTTKSETSLPMPCFENLTEVSADNRVSAVDKIKTHILSKDKSARGGDISYTVKRLVRGLASNRKMARVGFASALANCLSKQCVPLTDTLASLSDPTAGGQFLKTSGTMGKADRTQTYIGQLFFVASVAKGIVESESSGSINCDDLKKVASLCVDAFKNKPVLRQMACSVLGQLICAIMKNQETYASNKSIVFKVVEPLLKNGWPSPSSDIDAADLLLLALIAEPISPANFWSDSAWLPVEPADSPRQSFIYSLLADPGKVAAVIVSARQTPFVHLAAVKILEMLSIHITKRKIKKRFVQFWSELVNERFLLPASAASHKTAAIQLALVALTAFLPKASSLVPVVLSKPLLELLSSGLRRRLSREHEAVLAFFNELASSFPSNKKDNVTDQAEDYQISILACFIRPPLRIWNEFPSQFDKMVHSASPQTASKLCDLLKSIASSASYSFNYEINDDAVEEIHKWDDYTSSMSARRWAVSHLTSLIAQASAALSREDVESLLQTVIENCLFVDAFASENKMEDEEERSSSKPLKMGLFPREQAVNNVLKAINSCSSPSFSRHLSSTADTIVILKSVLGSVMTKLSDEENGDALLIERINDDAKKVLASLVKISKKKTPGGSILELLRLFACHVGIFIVCYSSDSEIVQLGQEISQMFSSISAGKEEENTADGPARVFIDMLIGLLSRKARPIRQLITSIYSKLIHNDKLLVSLTSTRNTDSETQASSLVDLIINALLNTQFVDDEAAADSADDDDDDDDDDEAQSIPEGEEDNHQPESVKKRNDTSSSKTKKNSGRIVASTSPALPPPDSEKFLVTNVSDEDDASSIDSVMMDDEQMFKLDSVFAAALKATSGPMKKAKKDRKNQLQQMKDFHMKLVSWLEMLIHRAQQLTVEDNDKILGYKIQTDIIAVLMNTLAGKKKVCSLQIVMRFCDLVKMIILPWRLNKSIEDGVIFYVGKALSEHATVILDASLTIVRNASSVPPKLEAAANAVELLLLCGQGADSASVKLKTISASLQNALEGYLGHPSPHGHLFFSILLNSPRLQLKTLENVFFDRLLKCVASPHSTSENKQEGDKSDDKSVKSKSFPRSQAARLLASSQLITSNSYMACPRLGSSLNSVVFDVIENFASNFDSNSSDTNKSAPQPWLYKSVVELSKRHVHAVLNSTSSEAEAESKLALFSKLAENIAIIRDKATGKKYADVRQICAAVLKLLKKPLLPKNAAEKAIKRPNEVAPPEKTSDDAKKLKMSTYKNTKSRSKETIVSSSKQAV